MKEIADEEAESAALNKWPLRGRPATDEGYASFMDTAATLAVSVIKTRENPEAKRAKEAEEKIKAEAAAAKKAPAKGKSAVPEIIVVVITRDPILDQLEDERYAVLIAEDQRLRFRVELLRKACVTTLEAVRGKLRGLYQAMDDWLGAAYQAETHSIEQLYLCGAAAIEGEKKLFNEYLLDVTAGFTIDTSSYILEPPPPPILPPLTERPMPRAFTVVQVQGVYDQFRLLAPQGCISVKRATELLKIYVSNAVDLKPVGGSNPLLQNVAAVPDAWRTVAVLQLQVSGLGLGLVLG